MDKQDSPVSKAFCKGPSRTWEALTNLEDGSCSRGHVLKVIQEEVDLVIEGLLLGGNGSAYRDARKAIESLWRELYREKELNQVALAGLTRIIPLVDSMDVEARGAGKARERQMRIQMV